jgi:pimeloyl-ACP methyl ester carboxylesterase
LWREAARVEPGTVPDPEKATKGATKGRTPRFVQRALDALSRSKFLAGVVESAFIFDLKQVSAYLGDPQVRRDVRARVTSLINDDTRVIVAHSLGTVVAYECLCAHPEWPVRALVTLGSPLGIRNVIFDRLEPRPDQGRGAWPGSIEHWSNIADNGDIVALVKDLAPCFGERVKDSLVYNGAGPHDILPYLTAQETGHAIAAGLG